MATSDQANQSSLLKCVDRRCLGDAIDRPWLECSGESVRIGFVYPAELCRCHHRNGAASRELSVPRRLRRLETRSIGSPLTWSKSQAPVR